MFREWVKENFEVIVAFLYRLAQRYGLTQHDAEEAAAETMCRLLSREGDLPKKPMRFAKAMARNILVDEIRRLKRDRKRDESIESHMHDGEDERTEPRDSDFVMQLMGQVLQEISAQPEPDRTVLQRVLIQGHDLPMVVKELLESSNPGATPEELRLEYQRTRKMVWRFKKRLRKKFGDGWDAAL